jgi:hypothetical protein
VARHGSVAEMRGVLSEVSTVRGPHAPFLVLSLLALFATGCGHQPSSPPKSEASKFVQNRLTEVIELPQQLLTFEPSRDDITVGCAIFSFEQSLVAETNWMRFASMVQSRMTTPSI